MNMCETIVGGGVFGTVIGAILGFVLNQWGSLKVYPQKWNCKYFEPSTNQIGNQYGISISYDYNCQIQLFNTSNNNKIIRDITFNFYNGEKLLFKDYPLINDNTLVVKKASAYTVQGKSITILDLRNSLSTDNASKIKNTTSVTLSYKSKWKNRTHEKRIPSFEPVDK
jgi:hypothetical protein